jgi:hypothetical protein
MRPPRDSFNAWLRRGLWIGIHVFWMTAISVMLIPAPRPADAFAISAPYVPDGTCSICFDIDTGRRVYHVCYNWSPPHAPLPEEN